MDKVIPKVLGKVFTNEITESLDPRFRRGLNAHPVQLILGLWILFLKYLWQGVKQPVQVVQKIGKEWEKPENLSCCDRFCLFLTQRIGFNLSCLPVATPDPWHPLLSPHGLDISQSWCNILQSSLHVSVFPLDCEQIGERQVVSSSSFVNLLEIIVMVPGTSWVPN